MRLAPALRRVSAVFLVLAFAFSGFAAFAQADSYIKVLPGVGDWDISVQVYTYDGALLGSTTVSVYINGSGYVAPANVNFVPEQGYEVVIDTNATYDGTPVFLKYATVPGGTYGLEFSDPFNFTTYSLATGSASIVFTCPEFISGTGALEYYTAPPTPPAPPSGGGDMILWIVAFILLFTPAALMWTMIRLLGVFVSEQTFTWATNFGLILGALLGVYAKVLPLATLMVVGTVAVLTLWKSGT